MSVLAQDRPSLAIVSGQGGAAGQRARVAELTMMAREQGREVQIIAADRRSQMNLKQDERLSGELITGRRQLREGMTFTPGSTVIVDQGEKLSLKETLVPLPESVLREPVREREAVREVARENLLQKRLQQMERDMVRDLQKEKTPGGD